jgi:hypothetical protein
MRVRSDFHQTRPLRALQPAACKHMAVWPLRALQGRGQPDHLRLPSVSFLPTSTACSAHHLAGLLHPAADHGVRPVSRLQRPTGSGTWGSAMPPAVLPPGIFSQGRTTLRSFSPVRSHPTSAVRPKSRPHLSLTPASPTLLLPSGRPDHSGSPRLASGPFTVGLPLSPLQPRLCSPLLSPLVWKALASPLSSRTSTVRLAQPLDLRVFLHVQIRCTCPALPPDRCPMLPWAFCSALTVLEDPLRRGHLRRGGRSTGCSGSAASPASRSGATRGRRDAGHRAPRSVAGADKDPKGKEADPGGP